MASLGIGSNLSSSPHIRSIMASSTASSASMIRPMDFPFCFVSTNSRSPGNGATSSHTPLRGTIGEVTDGLPSDDAWNATDTNSADIDRMFVRVSFGKELAMGTVRYLRMFGQWKVFPATCTYVSRRGAVTGW